MSGETVLDSREGNVIAGGFTSVPNSVFRNPKLSLEARVVFTLCLRYQKIWVRNLTEQLVIDTGADDASVKTYIDELVRAGLLTIIKDSDGDDLVTIHI